MATINYELVNSLRQEDIPIKLRCASCNRLVVNAFRLPCCDQSICETCQESLPESCPVCSHSPLSRDDCKPNKALRLTVKAFLKNEEKKRDKGKKNDTVFTENKAVDQEIAVEEPVLPENDSNEVTVLPSSGEIARMHSNAAANDTADSPKLENAKVEAEEIDGHDSVNQEHTPVNQDQDEERPDQTYSTEAQISASNKNEQVMQNFNSGNSGLVNMGNFNGWGNGGFNPLMAMQGNFGFPNMMSMNPMGMDPAMMMASGMFGGMGMNMGNMGFNGGFDGSNWGMMNGGSSNMTDMSGDFGAGSMAEGEPYFDPHYGGQKPFNQFQHDNYRPRGFRGNFGFRSRGRGRGRGSMMGYNAGGYHGHQQYDHPGQYQNHMNVSGDVVALASAERELPERDESLRIAPPDEDDCKSPAAEMGVETAPAVNMQSTDDPAIAGNSITKEQGGDALLTDSINETATQPNSNIVTTTSVPTGPSRLYTGPLGRGRGSYHAGRGEYPGISMPSNTSAPPVGAPTGPKALREGKPNSGYYSRATHASLVQSRGGATEPQYGARSENRATAPKSHMDDTRPAHSRNPSRSPIPSDSRESRKRARSHSDSTSRSRSPDRHRPRIEYDRHDSRGNGNSSHARKPSMHDDGDARSPGDGSKHQIRRDTRESAHFHKDSVDHRYRDVGGTRSTNYDNERHNYHTKDGHSDIERRRQRRDRSRSASPVDDPARNMNRHERHQSSSHDHYQREKDYDFDIPTKSSSRRTRRRHRHNASFDKVDNTNVNMEESNREYDGSDRYHSLKHTSNSKSDYSAPAAINRASSPHRSTRQTSVSQAPVSEVREFKVLGRSSNRKIDLQPPTGPALERARDRHREHDAGHESQRDPHHDRKLDPHARERLARDRERMAREQQRRGETNGSVTRNSGNLESRLSKRSNRAGYGNDETEARARRVEQEREMRRWE